MNKDIFQSVHKLTRQYSTRDPFIILREKGVTIRYSNRLEKLKGYCVCCLRSFFVVINSRLTEEEQRVVAAHELGHIVLHRSTLSSACLSDYSLYDTTSHEEREANAFAAELLLEDCDMTCFSEGEAADLFCLACTYSVPPELVAIKLQAMNARGYTFNSCDIPDSGFLGRIKTYAEMLSGFNGHRS